MFSQGERHREGDSMCCRFITLPRCPVLVLRPPVSPTYPGNCTLGTTGHRRVIQLVGIYNNPAVQHPKNQQARCSLDGTFLHSQLSHCGPKLKE